ncbi:glycosyltransferase family 4 protein [Rivularia sp. UHCC 0363]|uniref:glycosyltransferase family 4 protein n=1 Tax=Rivularia sp. UHCC 0363 TaxID=3110244 RepID=UPI002B1ED001|nr:glycosyltransferase family 4 protein [Rivularia sp. UHCC 0363]MEA5593804.1 glycosyltransferase family 4 protein [Rivularia sp. UHCC 0363]
MKIAVIGAKGLPPRQGGIEHYCAEVYPRMVAQGHSVDLFARSSYTDSSWLENYYFDGVKVISLPDVRMRGVDAFVTSALGALATTGNRYDIIHFQALGPSLFTGLSRITTNSKIVVTCHGLDWQRAKWGNFSTRLIQMGEQMAVRCAHGMIAVSDALKTYFLQTYGRDAVYIPTAPASYASSDPDFAYGSKLGLERGRYMLFLGRLVPEKRPDLLVEAFRNLQPSNWKLVLAGGVSNTKNFTAKLLEQIARDRNIVFAGELQGARLAEIVRGAGLFVLPSDVEGLPMAMLEAMREGIPILASNIPPHQQLIGSGRGRLFEAGSLESCIKELSWATDNSTHMVTMAHEAQDYVTGNYSWEYITNETLKLYEKLLNLPPEVNVKKPEKGLAGVRE